ncbi:MAG TPA: outer membrane beta-barrel protein [Vicinamibacterales bacterium]|nr:outer membrane beta-barrel protein [Vicinamibacterales bacterium]
MSIRRLFAIGFLLMVLFAPTAARADGFIVPFVGINFGGDAGQSLGSALDAKRLDWGASLGWMGAGVFGAELDLGYSPDFYGKNDTGGSSVLSLAGNLLVGVPFGGQNGFGIRPYGLVGIGMLKSDLDSFNEIVGFDDSEISWDFGGGVMMFFNQHVGLRGDIRYFRTFGAVDFGPIETEDSNAVDYTRGSAGLVFRF